MGRQAQAVNNVVVILDALGPRGRESPLGRSPGLSLSVLYLSMILFVLFPVPYLIQQLGKGESVAQRVDGLNSVDPSDGRYKLARPS